MSAEPNSSSLSQETIVTLPDLDARTGSNRSTLADALTSASENCARIKDLGFTTSKHITMYGEHFELLSDPFVDGDYTAVRAISQNGPGIRTLRLPVAILVGLADRFRHPAKLTGHETP
jgi:hypothetical protein